MLLLDSSSSILAFWYSFFLFSKCLLASHLTLFRISILIRFGSCIHCILACFLLSKNHEHSSSNHRSATSIHTELFSHKNSLLNHHFSPHLVHALAKQWYYERELSELYMTYYYQYILHFNCWYSSAVYKKFRFQLIISVSFSKEKKCNPCSYIVLFPI